MESKNNVKYRLFQKECRAVDRDSVIILLIVLPLKTFKTSEQSFTMLSVLGISQRWWDSRVTWNRWFGFKWSNCSHCFWKLFYWHCLICVCNWGQMCWYRWHGHNVPKSQPYLLCNYLEKLNDNKRSVVYQRHKKDVFLYKESIVYPLVEFEPNHN